MISYISQVVDFILQYRNKQTLDLTVQMPLISFDLYIDTQKDFILHRED